MLLLLLARLLVACVPMRYWRKSLGRMAAPSPTSNDYPCRTIVQSVVRGAYHLPIEMVCLPRAMAVQWMLRRRGQPSALVFGILPQQSSGGIHALHAWVEVGADIIIGDDPTRAYARGLTLVQP